MPDDVFTFTSESRNPVAGSALPQDQDPEILSLRPERLADYVGQAEVIETLKIAIEASTQRREPIDHVLLQGPPGLGKTTLAHIIANEMGGNLTVSSGPALEKGGDLIGILTHLEDGDILFIDEIHRTPKTVEEFMTQPAVHFDENENLEDICKCLVEVTFRRVPVTKGEKVVGIVSRPDVLKCILSLSTGRINV